MLKTPFFAVAATLLIILPTELLAQSTLKVGHYVWSPSEIYVEKPGTDVEVHINITKISGLLVRVREPSSTYFPINCRLTIKIRLSMMPAQHARGH